MKKPQVSVILPVYNSEEYLLQTLQSISKQSLKEIEIVAVCDKSKDNSLNILKKYKKEDKRLKIFENAGRYGLAATLNRAISNAKSDFIVFSDTRGITSPRKLKKQLKFLLDNPEVAAIGTQCFVIDHKGTRIMRSNFPLEHNEIYKGLISGQSMQFETVMVHKKILPNDILYFTKDRYPFLYVELMLKISQYKKIANLSDALSSTRKKKPHNQIIEIKRRIAFLRMLLKSSALYSYRPYPTTFFAPFIKSRFYL